MNLIDQNVTDRLIDYMVVVGHGRRLHQMADEWVSDPFAPPPPMDDADEEEEKIQDPVYPEDDPQVPCIDAVSEPDFNGLLSIEICDSPEHSFRSSTASLLESIPSGTPSLPDIVDGFTESERDAAIEQREQLRKRLLERLKYKMFRVQVLDRYPKEDHVDSPFPLGIPLFCVPEGGLRVSDSPDLPRFYFFACTLSTGEKVFGACLAFQEELLPPVRNALLLNLELEDRERLYQEQLDEWEDTGREGQKPIAATPLPKLLREYADDILNKKLGIPSLWTTKCMCLLSHFPYLQQFRSLLNEIYRLTLAPCKIPFEHMVMHIIDELPLPPPGVFNVHTVIGNTDVSFSRPPLNSVLSPCAVSTLFLFQNLSADNIITIVEALLLERRVLVLSDRLSALAPACEALLLLIYPFRWQHVYVPLLPKMLNGFLHAPMPFFIGAHTSVETIVDDEVLDEIVVVYLDTDKVVIAEPLESQLPSKDRAKLSKALQVVSKQVYRPPLPSELGTKYQQKNKPTSFTNPKKGNDDIEDDNAPLLGWGGALADCAITLAPLPMDDTYDVPADELLLEEIEDTIRKSFYRAFISIFRDLNEFLSHPFDITKLSISFPLPLSSIPMSLNGNVTAYRARDQTLAPQVNMSAAHILNINLNSGFGPGKSLDPAPTPQSNSTTTRNSVTRTNSVARRSSMITDGKDSRNSISKNEQVTEDDRRSVSSVSPTSSSTLSEDISDTDTFFNEASFLKRADPSARGFLKIFVGTQAFQRFVDEHTYPSLAAENAHHLLFFKESLSEKHNRSLFARRQHTPFLLSPLGKTRAILHAPLLSAASNGQAIIYRSFPRLNYDNLHKKQRYPIVQPGLPDQHESLISFGPVKISPAPPSGPPPPHVKVTPSPKNNMSTTASSASTPINASNRTSTYSFSDASVSSHNNYSSFELSYDKNGFLHMYLTFSDTNPDDDRRLELRGSFNSSNTPTILTPNNNIFQNKDGSSTATSPASQTSNGRLIIPMAPTKVQVIADKEKEHKDLEELSQRNQVKQLSHVLLTNKTPLGGGGSNNNTLTRTSGSYTPYNANDKHKDTIVSHKDTVLPANTNSKASSLLGLPAPTPVKLHVITSLAEMKTDISFPEAGCLLPIYFSLYISENNISPSELGTSPIPSSLRVRLGLNATKKLEKLAIQAKHVSLSRSLIIGAPPAVLQPNYLAYSDSVVPRGRVADLSKTLAIKPYSISPVSRNSKDKKGDKKDSRDSKSFARRPSISKSAMSIRTATEDTKVSNNLAMDAYRATKANIENAMNGITINVFAQCNKCDQVVNDPYIRQQWKIKEANGTEKEREIVQHDEAFLKNYSMLACPSCEGAIYPELRIELDTIVREESKIFSTFFPPNSTKLTIPYISVFLLRRALGSFNPGLKASAPSPISTVFLLKPAFRTQKALLWAILWHVASIDLPIAFFVRAHLPNMK